MCVCVFVSVCACMCVYCAILKLLGLQSHKQLEFWTTLYITLIIYRRFIRLSAVRPFEFELSAMAITLVSISRV